MSPSPNDLSFSWDLPTLLGGEVIDYRVEVNKLRFRQGTRDVVELVIADYKTNNMTASITQGLGELWPCSNFRVNLYSCLSRT